MHKERNKMLFKMLCNRLLYAILLSGFFTFGTYAAFAQEGAEAEAAEEAPAQGADGIPTSEAALAEGKKLYTNACAVCHGIHEQVVGPALVNVTDRRPVEWLIDFIHNSQKVIQSGDEYAVNIYNQFNKMQMPNFDYLSNDEVLSILAYIQQESQVTASAAAEGGDGVATTGTTAGESQGGVSSEYLTLIIAGFIFILVLILIVLILLTVVLTKFLKNKDDLDEEDKAVLEQKTDLGKVFKHKAFIGLLAFLFVAVALRAVLDGLFTIGVQQGYAPTQPIAFSHALHAGEFEIDCNYCHTGVRKSKNANIPSANICMNCHSMITKVTGEEEDSKEIRKIHAAIENNQPIEWVRVHNLPDLAYFSHVQHVEVGGVECQTCHGPIEEMEVVRQHESLTMGWCINCHRETKINADNEYYDKLVALHATVSKEPMTVEDIGGLECAKCHY